MFSLSYRSMCKTILLTSCQKLQRLFDKYFKVACQASFLLVASQKFAWQTEFSTMFWKVFLKMLKIFLSPEAKDVCRADICNLTKLTNSLLVTEKLMKPFQCIWDLRIVLYLQLILFHRQLLSQQQHYEWGLRALKPVLRGCGSLLQKEKKSGRKSMMKFFLITFFIYL